MPRGEGGILVLPGGTTVTVLSYPTWDWGYPPPPPGLGYPNSWDWGTPGKGHETSLSIMGWRWGNSPPPPRNVKQAHT